MFKVKGFDYKKFADDNIKQYYDEYESKERVAE